MPGERPIELTILTGFLGAGKTTLLNRLLKDPALADTAVVINEFGETAIDHLLVEQATDGIIELGGGCLCCTVRGELADTLTMLAARPQKPRRVVVETSGLADPVPTIQLVMGHPSLSGIYLLAGVITVVDAVNGAQALDAHEVARKQVAVADRLVVTKAELASDVGKTLPARLAELNSHAGILDSRAPGAAALLESGFEAHRHVREGEGQHGDHGHDHHEHHHDDFNSVSLAHDKLLPLSTVEAFLDLLASQQGDRILRIKGLAATAERPERPLLLQGAQRLLHAPEWLPRWPEGAPRETRIVVIGHALDTDYVRRIFAAFTGQPATDTPDRTALEDNPLAIAGFRP